MWLNAPEQEEGAAQIFGGRGQEKLICGIDAMLRLRRGRDGAPCTARPFGVLATEVAE
jgi:hypothetical protein